MNNLTLLRQLGAFFAYVLLQIFFLKEINLFGVAFCFLYINFLLFLPPNTDNRLLLFLGFLVGVFVDGFYNSLGINAFACVLIMYLRPFVLNFLADRNEVYTLSLAENGIVWYLQYTVSLTFVHHLFIFALDQFSISYILEILFKTIASTIFTISLSLLIQYLFFSPLIKNAR